MCPLFPCWAHNCNYATPSHLCVLYYSPQYISHSSHTRDLTPLAALLSTFYSCVLFEIEPFDYTIFQMKLFVLSPLLHLSILNFIQYLLFTIL